MEDKTKEIFDRVRSTAAVVGKKVAEAAGKAGDKTREFIDNTKQSVAIHEVEREIDRLYGQIGRCYYEARKSGLHPEGLEELIAAVDIKLEEIEQLAAKMEDGEETRFCPNPDCGKPCFPDDKFCSSCGTVIE